MRDAATVLATIRSRGHRGRPVRDLYRMLFLPDLYLRAYHKLYPNRGALTPGATPETVDGMSLAKIERLIDDVRHERYRWTPVRRVSIPKRTGKRRPLGLPSWSDKLRHCQLDRVGRGEGRLRAWRTTSYVLRRRPAAR